MSRLTIDGPWFRDEQGRVVLLRGVNLAGSSKVPRVPDGATHHRERFFEHREVSFVGRPFPLDEADEHFSRLRAWGFNFLRLLMTWEAIEHAGPGVYDEAYLDYFQSVVQKAGEHGFWVLIDPHQDVWSRFCGGDGAPGWTLEAVGFELENLHPTGAAFLHPVHGDPCPAMIWPTNGTKLAAATMFTLFFAGDTFAPRTRVDGEPVQEYLQRHYLQAMERVAARLKGMNHVVGYDTMNEPLRGYIGWTDLTRPYALPFVGEVPSPYQSMLLGSGFAQDVLVYATGRFGPTRSGTRRVDPRGLRSWRSGRECVWRDNGVWDRDHRGMPVLLRPNHFAAVDGREVDFADDFYRPFANRFARSIRKIDPEAHIFIETEAFADPPHWRPSDAERVVFAPHWYDGYVLFMKDFHAWLAAEAPSGRLAFGERRIRRSFADQIRRYQRASSERLGNAPVVIGEFGITFDMKDRSAYKSGVFAPQEQAMDRSMRAMEDVLANCALWNYTPDNDNQHGDQWNGEDLSIFSRDQQRDPSDIHSGGRALAAVVRPYAERTAGLPLRMSYDFRRKDFEFVFKGGGAGGGTTTEICVPGYIYPCGFAVDASDGTFRIDRDQGRVLYTPSSATEDHRLRIRPAS